LLLPNIITESEVCAVLRGGRGGGLLGAGVARITTSPSASTCELEGMGSGSKGGGELESRDEGI
jgi:hypothetical protein